MSDGRVISVNVGLPRAVRWKGRDVTTGIFKEPVEGRVPVRLVNLDGDRQADLTVHGGPDKAVYAYPLEHYSYWEEELERELPLGVFGENLTVAGVPLEDEAAIGDRLRVGTAELVVTQPRLPCYKLGVRFGREDMVKRFLASGRSGYYLAVAMAGDVGAGDGVETLVRDPAGIPVSEITRVYARARDDVGAMERLIALDALPDDWRSHFQKKLTQTVPAVKRRGTSALRGPAGQAAAVREAGGALGGDEGSDELALVSVFDGRFCHEYAGSRRPRCAGSEPRGVGAFRRRRGSRRGSHRGLGLRASAGFFPRIAGEV